MGDFTKVCVVFNKGLYYVYVNGEVVVTAVEDPTPVNSMSATTLGFVEGKDLFHGYIDNVSVNT